MKGLSIEKKAKRYDEAIAHAKLLLKTIGNATLGNLVLKNEFENIFPELKESEDERIRKELLAWLKSREGQTLPIDRFNAAIAWLEKQKEDTYNYKRVDLDKFDERIQEFSDMLEDKPKPYWDGWYEAMEWIRTHGNPFEEQGEQKPAWSEEDEERLKDTIGCLTIYKEDTDVRCSQSTLNDVFANIDWLRSLRPREMNKWRKEDEVNINAIIDYLKETDKNKNRGYVNFLKSLRPQNRWKPSEEQMLALEAVLTVSPQSPAMTSALIELYEDLKKLKE